MVKVIAANDAVSLKASVISMKHVHYIPQYNEAEFNRIAKAADPILIKRRERAKRAYIVSHRNAFLRELHALRVKPFRTIEDDKRMGEISAEIKRIMQQINNK